MKKFVIFILLFIILSLMNWGSRTINLVKAASNQVNSTRGVSAQGDNTFDHEQIGNSYAYENSFDTGINATDLQYALEMHLANVNEGPSGVYQAYLPTISTPTESISTQPVWRALLLVYHNTDVDYMDENGVQQHLTTTMPESEMQKALWSFRQAASIAHDFSDGEAIIEYDIVNISRPINSLTLIGESPSSLQGDRIEIVGGRPILAPVRANAALTSQSYWVSPNDSRIELDTYAPPGKYDSIFIHWMQCDMDTNQCIPSFGWGWGLIATSWSNGATYATVANAEDWLWEIPTVGEVWVHEWLHGASPFYESLGYPQPEGNADGGSGHGYEWSPTDGWAAYYRDLMTGQVWEPLIGAYTGIPAQAWRERSILSFGEDVFVDYFYEDTTSSYQQLGSVVWNGSDENIMLGNAVPNDNKLYKHVTFNKASIVSGRVYVPDTNVGNFDTIAVALNGEGAEYWATLAYGSSLTQKNNISIMRNDTWGNLYPLILNPGWYTVKVLVDYPNGFLRMKAWPDGADEPGWQTSRTLDANWITQDFGFRHYGQGTNVDDLRVIEVDN